MVDVKVEGVVRAPPAEVFEFLADLENWPKWQSDMKTSQLVGGRRGQKGAQYHYVSKAMGLTMDSTVDIVRLEPGRLIAFEGPWAGMIRPRGTFEVEAAPGGTRVVLNPHPEVRGLGKLMSFMMGPAIRKLQHQHLDGLRRALER